MIQKTWQLIIISIEICIEHQTAFICVRSLGTEIYLLLIS